MKSYLSFVLCAAAVLAVASPAGATLVYYEGFNYAATTSLDGVGGWTDNGDIVKVVSSGLTYTGLATAGGAAHRAADYGPPAYPETAHKLLGSSVSDLFKSTDSTFYMSLLIGDSVGGNADRAMMQLWMRDGLGGYNSDGIEASTGGSPATGVTRIYDIGAGEGSAAVLSEMAGTRFTVYRITMKVGDDEMAVIRNPDLIGGGDLDPADFDAAATGYGEISASSLENIDYLSLKFGGYTANGQGDNSMIDEIRIGTTLADVIPVPEPVTLTVLAIGGLALLRRRRR